MKIHNKLSLILLLVLTAVFQIVPDLSAGRAEAQDAGDHEHAAQAMAARMLDPTKNFLTPATRQALQSLSIQDYQGRMKPLDTLSREMMMKMCKSSSFDGWNPIDFYLGLMSRSDYWYRQPIIAIRHPELKEMLKLDPDTRHLRPADFIMEDGSYRLQELVARVHRKPDSERSKAERKLLSLDERANICFMTMRQVTFRTFPQPGDANDSWLSLEDVLPLVDAKLGSRYRAVNEKLMTGFRSEDDAMVLAACGELKGLQHTHGSGLLVTGLPLKSELFLNQARPFIKLIPLYLIAALLLMTTWIVSLARRGGDAYRMTNPLYLTSLVIFLIAMAIHLGAFVLRWIASGRAPLSNGYESLIWISLTVAVAGLIFELRDRKGLLAGLAALLTFLVLGVATLATFDPAIGPLVPVLSSYWLIIHVTIITASYGFLGEAALVSMTLMVLLLFKKPGRPAIRDSVTRLHSMNWKVMVAGLGMLSIGTLLGGVWANESWGRYWGWDSKETWSLVTILVYACIVHFRFIKGLNRPWLMAAAGLAGISSVIMTYFGVNYFLAGLHSYGGGAAATVPDWIYIALGLAIALMAASWWTDKHRTWDK
jgi:cytochrome c-type biogenesis protein CcsB